MISSLLVVVTAVSINPFRLADINLHCTEHATHGQVAPYHSLCLLPFILNILHISVPRNVQVQYLVHM